MTAYYVMAIVLVVGALGLSTVGIMRRDFPPSRAAGRAIVAVSALLIAATVVILIATTHKEHPREEAKAEAASEQATGAKEVQPAGSFVEVQEKEYSVAVPGGGALKAGSYSFRVANQGKIPHDLAVEGSGARGTKTPLIDPGKGSVLKADLKSGTYKFYCTVPGHEQLGMKAEVTVK